MYKKGKVHYNRIYTNTQWQHQGGGAWGHFGGSAPPPHLPPNQKKNAKINHFRQIFGFLPPQSRILPPSMPLTKNSGAATANTDFLDSYVVIYM